MRRGGISPVEFLIAVLLVLAIAGTILYILKDTSTKASDSLNAVSGCQFLADSFTQHSSFCAPSQLCQQEYNAIKADKARADANPTLKLDDGFAWLTLGTVGCGKDKVNDKPQYCCVQIAKPGYQPSDAQTNQTNKSV